MIHVPRVDVAGPGTSPHMNPISMVAGVARNVLKVPITLAGSAVRLAQSVAGGNHGNEQQPSSREPKVEISPDQPVNVTEELGLDPSPVAKPKRPRKQPEKPVTGIDAAADPSDVDVTPADVADAVSHRAPRPTDG